MKDLSLKAARVDKGFTQEALAEILGVSKKTVISWENGEVKLKPYVLYALAYIYDIDADLLRVPLH
ncbi:helix-turn-helix transcriptional regulator [Schinkia azotoformans]|uniref:helix-turn-helix transcriptional regulator n=1 Tax=Schinkia azotoformans TaxID=1454 RepID=UPI002DBB92EC|nr:helix-turn-helix transcriptional regulator [Schinkia azotoformans]MEC1714996.1 helix-turn-helix transcriptional regulator [Schinkia azotoformans]MEC1740230.1 helix-turn-helix transcriptional regulator [Schinkia azotoformans]MEC1747139.1 helix-turn-helix transcriptional regulator [Schinkia azotoformans]MEC1766117.1 helix-turn-helix transcriptional regulator [Schinkia azotoformans]MEC1785327.1 helix-turn-helix transcriptional regulator [Schinkia azotoformans]